jgi:histidinol-phosphatase (PHP family)
MDMIRANYHTHCSYCDGGGLPEDFVKESVARKMAALGFSCHAPLPFPNAFTMAVEKLGEYVSTVQELKRKYAGDICVYLGLEIDFIPGLETFQSSFSALGLEYSIGSVHYVDCDEQGNPWAIDADLETFADGMTGVYHGNGRAAVERYYALVREMVQETRHDMVGHLDIIKKNNGSGRFFSEDAPWYDAAVEETLALIAEKSRIVEVNTAGLRKRVGLYPSVDILKRCKEFNILLTINSDAHQPADVDADYPEVRDLLLSIGYKEIYQLTPHGWESSPLE